MVWVHIHSDVGGVWLAGRGGEESSLHPVCHGDALARQSGLYHSRRNKRGHSLGDLVLSQRDIAHVGLWLGNGGAKGQLELMRSVPLRNTSHA